MIKRVTCAIVLAATLALTGCGGESPAPSAADLPSPVCGGIEIFIEGALPCAEVTRIAVRALAERAPDQLARGVESIDVFLTSCPRNEVPPQVECGTEEFAQMVTITFARGSGGGFAEPSLTVAVGPVSGRVLGVVNPLIR